MISKISLSCVPAKIRSAFQQTLRMDRPETRTQRVYIRAAVDKHLNQHQRITEAGECPLVSIQTFVSVLHLPQVNLGDGFEVHVPESDAAVSPSCGKSFFTGMHAEDPSLEQTRHCFDIVDIDVTLKTETLTIQMQL